MSDSEITSAHTPAPANQAWPSGDVWIDERGHRCPAPVIALARAAREADAGTMIVVVADDPAADFDIPAWCRMTGNHFVDKRAADPGAAFLVRVSER